MFIVPYLVLLGVCLLFLPVAYVIMFGLPKKSGHAAPQERHVKSEKKMHFVAEDMPRKEEKNLYTDEKTQIITFDKKALKKNASLDVEKTMIFEREEVEAERPKAKPLKESSFPPEAEPFVIKDTAGLRDLEEYFVRHFLNRYGAVTKTVENDTRRVTHHLIEALHLRNKDAVDTLAHIMVQEAMQNAQRTFVMMPTDLVLEMVTAAFVDVASGKRSETKTILAYDALKAMPRMESAQFHALALLLLFHYSRNTDNYDARHLKSYANKYIAPFLSDLPDEYTGYQQLEYLHCISLENKDTPFGQVLHDSYPFVFAFKGFMKAEADALIGEAAEHLLVPSVYNSYVKPKAVDEGTLFSLLESHGISDGQSQKSILALIESRPVAYDRKELQYVLGKISSDLEKMQESWDTSLLRRSSLTLMGMYIAKICIREVVGEEFDLSHWM